MRAGYPGDRHRAGVLSGAFWIGLAVIACLSVLLINGRPLFYFDTVGYIDQGQSVLDRLGLIDLSERADNAAPAADGAAQATAVAPTEAAAAAPGARTVDGSRSIFYSVAMGALASLGALELMNLLHAAAVIVAIWLPMKVAARLYPAPFDVPMLVAMPVLAAALGSMPFFVAYLMPDIFAPVMILTIATAAVFGREMRLWELALAFALGSIAVVSHLSHLAIAGLMVPAAVLIALILRRGTWWLALIFTVAIVLVAFAQQATIRAAASKVADSEVIIRPFLTARLIQDGPGYAYLEERCPDPDYPTCALHQALQLSDDPWRLTASHIIFKQSPDLGSFRLMPEEDQVRVARNQVGFFRDVLFARPIDTTVAFLKNTLVQTTMFSVDMTFASDSIIAQHDGVRGLLTGPFVDGRITSGDDAWLTGLTRAQGVWYALCLLITLALIVRPAGLPPELRALAVLLLLGILANALVCGGISQPASRYGARMIWLLPVAAAMLVLFRNAGAARWRT